MGTSTQQTDRLPCSEAQKDSLEGKAQVVISYCPVPSLEAAHGEDGRKGPVAQSCPLPSMCVLWLCVSPCSNNPFTPIISSVHSTNQVETQCESCWVKCTSTHGLLWPSAWQLSDLCFSFTPIPFILRFKFVPFLFFFFLS